MEGVASRLYGIVWRWHFVIGLLAVPIVCVIALTGALYAFEPELSTLDDERLVIAEPADKVASLDAQARAPFALDTAIALATTPQCKPTAMYVPSRRDRAWLVYCAQGEHRVQLIDPYRVRGLFAKLSAEL